MWLDNNKDKDNELTRNASNTSVGSGGGGATNTGTTSSSTPGTTPLNGGENKPQSFATIQDYLKTNQPQAEDLGQKFTNQLDTTYNTQKGNIDTAANQTNQDIQSNTVNYNTDLVNEAKNDPTKVANDENKSNDFLKQWNAQYSGPQNFETSNNYTGASEAANQANEIKGQLGSVGGREQLIQNQFGVYGQGNKGLDQALLQTSSYFPQVQGKESQFGSIQDYLNQQSKDLSDKAQQAQKATDQTKSSIQDAFLNQDSGVVPQFTSQLNQEVANNKQTATQRSKDAQAALNKKFSDINNHPENMPSEQALKDLGLTADEYKNMLLDQSRVQQGFRSGMSDGVNGENVDFNKYSTILNPDAQVGLENTISPEEYAKALALAKLTGNQNILPLVNGGNVGKSQPSVIDFKKQDLLNYLKSKTDAIKAASDQLSGPKLPPSNGGNVYKSQPVSETPAQPVEPAPQVNPGPTTPTQNVFRGLSSGGLVKSLQDYLKRDKR